MRHFLSLLFIFSLSSHASGTTIDEMNRAFKALTGLLPYLAEDGAFREKKFEKHIETNLSELTKTFSGLKHEAPLTRDVFAPSYQVIMEHLQDTQKSFREGRKDYAQWRLKELTSLCLDCHSRLPEDHASQYQEGRLTVPAEKFKNPYNLGIAQLIVRQYSDAKTSFTRVIDDSLIKKNFNDTERSFKQLLLIRTKILSEHSAMLETVRAYQQKKELPQTIKKQLGDWEKRLTQIQKLEILKSELKDDKSARALIDQVLKPIHKEQAELVENRDVDLLSANGQLSRYLFSYPNSALVPEISFWIGWSEKVLRRENFFGSGEFFLKQCIRRYPSHQIAPQCYNELVEILEFEFSGSSGTHIPQDIRNELEQLQTLINSSSKKKN